MIAPSLTSVNKVSSKVTTTSTTPKPYSKQDFTPNLVPFPCVDTVILHHEERSVYAKRNIKNFRIKVTETGTLVMGSIPKYVHQNNIQPVTLYQVNEVLEELSEVLGLSLLEADVRRLDIGCNFIVDLKPKAYFPYFTYCSRMERLEQPNALYFQNGMRVAIIYDKIKEAKKSRQVFPPEFLELNILRYELRFMRSVMKQFRRKVFGADLVDQQFQRELVHRWLEGFDAIEKTHKTTIDPTCIRTAGDYEQHLKQEGIEHKGGLGPTFQDIKVKMECGAFNGKEVQRARDKVKALSELSNTTINPVAEIERKVYEATRPHLS